MPQTQPGFFYFGALSGRNLTRLITLRGIEAGGPTRKLEKAGTQTGAGAKGGQVESDLSEPSTINGPQGSSSAATGVGK